jgi:transcriptional regulator of heat shock response
MTNESHAKLVALMLDKSDLVTQMRTLTESTEFFGDVDEADKYIELVDKRQECIDKITAIDEKLKGEPYASILQNPQKELKDQLDAIGAAISEESSRITELEKQNADKIQQIKMGIIRDLQGVNKAKSIKAAYQQSGPSGSFDTKH